MWGCGSHTAPSHHVQHHQAHTPARFLTPEAPVCWIILPQGWVITVPNPMYGGSILGLQRNSPSLLFASQPVPRVPQFLHLRVKQEVYQTPPGGTHKQLWCFRGHNSSPCSVQEQVLRTQRGKTNTSEKKIRSKPSDPKLNFPPPLGDGQVYTQTAAFTRFGSHSAPCLSRNSPICTTRELRTHTFTSRPTPGLSGCLSRKS